MIECRCGRWYEIDSFPDFCQCGQQMRFAPEEAMDQDETSEQEA